MTSHGRFQPACNQPRNDQRNDQTDDERARPESPKNKRANSNGDKERFPNLGIAQPSHEQVKGRTRPLFVNEMKKGLFHAIEGDRIKL
jgi:hypothetical protein